VSQVEQGGCGHEDDLQHPEADMRDGEGFVVADVLAARLQRVAFEGRLLVSPRLHRRTQDQDPEHEEDRQPQLPPGCGVRLDFVQQTTQGAPVAHGERALACEGEDMKLHTFLGLCAFWG
uniref:Uncharacterized protein n=1 Tax=Labrus bergylta TaxID=56723 RepID=A0A3Q3E2C9_9LABR